MEDEKDIEAFSAFRKQVLKECGKGKKGKVRNSVGVYDIYKAIRKKNWYDIGRPLKEHEFYSIIRGMNLLMAAEISLGHTVTFPSRMGCLELRKFHPTARYVDGKLKVSYPVDWDSTLKLWFTDAEARKDKILIRFKDTTTYRVKYCRAKANYNNKNFYEFVLNDKIKKALKTNIRNGDIDTLYQEW